MTSDINAKIGLKMIFFFNKEEKDMSKIFLSEWIIFLFFLLLFFFFSMIAADVHCSKQTDVSEPVGGLK